MFYNINMTINAYTYKQIYRELKENGIEDSLVENKLTAYSHTMLTCAVILIIDLGALTISLCLAFSALTVSLSSGVIGVTVFLGVFSLIIFAVMAVGMTKEYRAIHRKLSATERREILDQEIQHLQYCFDQEEEQVKMYRNASLKNESEAARYYRQMEIVDSLRG